MGVHKPYITKFCCLAGFLFSHSAAKDKGKKVLKKISACHFIKKVPPAAIKICRARIKILYLGLSKKNLSPQHSFMSGQIFFSLSKVTSRLLKETELQR